MPKFKILQTEPLELKSNILEFWEKYLPGTTPDRFDWLQSNPEGPTAWLFAFDVENNELAGTVSIMKHDLFQNGKVLHAGVIGDFMVSEKYRVFGPAIPLQKAVIESKKELNLDVLYTVPNLSSLKLSLRVGYIEKIKLLHMVRPLKTEGYILKHVNNKYFNKITSIILDNILMLFSGIYISNNDQFELVDNVDDSFDDFWLKIKSDPSKLLGNRGSEYLNWRYCQNPNSRFQFLKYNRNKTGELLGYIVYSIDKNRVAIYDVIALNNKHAGMLLKKLLRIAYSKKYSAVNIRIASANSLVNKLKKFMFIDAKDDISILVFDDGANYDYEDWIAFENDRNI